MSNQENNPTKQPLTREDVKRLIAQAAGDPGKVDLSFQDLTGANLSKLDLKKINLIGANLSRANLSGANLSGAGLLGVNLSQANLSRANLAGTGLLTENRVPGDGLPGYNPLSANLSGIDLSGADFLTDAFTPPPIAASIKILSNLPSQVWVQKKLTSLATMYGDMYTCEVMQQWREQQLADSEIVHVSAKLPPEIEVNPTDAQTLQERNEELSRDSIPVPAQKLLRFRVEQKPLYNMTRILMGLTEIHAKAFFISQGRYADLIDCIQNHNSKFRKEAYLDFIPWPPHSLNSSADFEAISTPKSNVNIKAKAAISQTKLAEAFSTSVEIMVNFFKTHEAELQELQLAEADLKVKAQQVMAALADQTQARSIKVQEAELHEKQLALSEQTFHMRLASFNKATEATEQMVTILQPNADPATKAMLIHSVLLDFYELREVKGLVLLPLLPSQPENKGIDQSPT